MTFAEKLSVVICSKNRPTQLFALLESMTNNSDIKPENVKIIYKYENGYDDALYEVMAKYPSFEYVMEYNFQEQIKDFINDSKEYLMFLMDDQVFINKINFENTISWIEKFNKYKDFEPIFAFSLRLGLNTNYCYPVGKEQKVPNLIKDDLFYMWNYHEAELDWNYPLSLDGHIIRKQHWHQMINQIQFKSPNTLEANLQVFNSSLPKMCACCEKSITVNLPINKVQNDFDNKHGTFSEKELLNIWNSGKKINVEKLFNVKTNAAHQELELEFIER